MQDNCLTCTVCTIHEIELYFCETCSTPPQDQIRHSPQNQLLLCEPCLASHVRQGHQVRTSNGREPLICNQHRRLHSEYCESCDESFCPKCLGNHSGHFMGSIDERAAEIRKEVFSMLTTLECNEKPLRAKKNEICELKMKHQIDQKDLKDAVENQINKLREKMLTRLAENEAIVEKEQNKVSEGIEQVLRIQEESRRLLSTTDPHLVNKFKDVKLSFEKACNSFEQTMLTKIKIKSSSFHVLDEIFDEIGQTIDDKLRSDFETEKLEIVEHALLNGKDGSKFCLIIENGEANILSVKVAEGQEPMLEKLGKKHLNFIGPIKACYSVYSDHHVCSCVLLTHAKAAYRFDLNEQIDLELNEIKHPFFDNLVCPYTVPTISEDINWCHWSEERLVLKFSHRPSFELRCPTRPIFGSLDIDGHKLCVLAEGGNVFIINTERREVELFLATFHGIEDISHVTLYRGSDIFVWANRSKILNFYVFNNEWRSGPTQTWSEETDKNVFKSLKTPLFSSKMRFYLSLKLDYNEKSYQYECVALSD